MIDIKLFKANNKYKIVNGMLEKLGVKETLENKEIELYNIKNDDIKNLTEYKDMTDLYFNLIPLLSNVDMTVSTDELNDMLENQTIAFEEFLNAFNENLKDIMTSKQKGIKINEDINKFFEDNGIDIEALKELEEQKQELQVVRTKEDIEKEIQELYENMKLDKQHRSEILEKIDILEKELNEMSE